MDSPSTSERKSALEDLPKEELLKKCRNLLSIAQKAKQAKDELQEENEALKKQLGSGAASNELIETLTKQKLEGVNQVDQLRKQNSILSNNLQTALADLCVSEQKYNDLDSENIALKKQVKRLGDENEQLLTHLDVLEKEIEALKKLGLEQQNQLLAIEERNKSPIPGGDIDELQALLQRKSEENENLLEKLEVLKINLGEKDKNIVTISQESEALRENVTKLREKLKSYHSKIVKFAGNVKTLKETKNEALQVLKTYTSQVEEWKTQLNSTSDLILAYIVRLQQENSDLKENNAKFMLHHKTDDEKSKEIDETVRINNVQLSEQLEYCQKRVEILTEENVKLTSELSGILDKHSEELKYFDDRNQKDAVEIRNRTEENEKICIEYRKIISKFEEDVEKYLKDIDDLQKKNQLLEEELEHLRSNERQFAEQTSQEILKLVQENAELTQKLERKVSSADCDSQTDRIRDPEELGAGLKRENCELLAEMNEMNQALKERGETVSQLQAHCDEIKKKLQVYENQANRNYDNITEKEDEIKNLSAEKDERDTLISQLKSELESLRERLDSSYAESDHMSTSTISKGEELNRMKDLEGSWEERYGKLRTLALKFKGKIRELTTELTTEQKQNSELQAKHAQSIESAEANIAKLRKELADMQKLKDSYESGLKIVSSEHAKEQGKLTDSGNEIAKLRKEITELKEEKTKTETWKKQVSAKVQTLRKEVEADRVLKKDFESQIAKLQADLEAKDKALKREAELHQQTRHTLQNSNSEIKKNSLLNLEMQDYERSVNDLSQKLEKKNETIEKLRNQCDSHKTTIDALREQNKLLEDRVRDIDSELEQAKTEIVVYKKQIVDLEALIVHKDAKISDYARTLEVARSENEELSTELSKIVSEHQKVNGSLRSEKDNLRSEILSLQQQLRETQNNFKLKVDELESVRNDYENYKVRAQSVFRQSQNRDVGLEERLSEEVNNLKTKCHTLQSQLEEYEINLKAVQSANESLRNENSARNASYNDVKEELDDLKTRYEQLSNKYQQTIVENAESVRGLKLHAETLAQCYRQQLSEQEVRHNHEILELQHKIDRAAPSPIDVPSLSLIQSMPREEGEGSESIDSIGKNNFPLPLERLLGRNEVDQVDSINLRKQLNEEETKVAHLTALLADTEQDLAKHVQMNKLLKEEIRRQQRSVEREKHAENLEYLKNVVFKFVTLHSGDERGRLVPVLNTILKLSPEETQKLAEVARGDLKGWSNYLPSWPSASKS